MMVEGNLIPIRLWLAPAPPHTGDDPERQDDNTAGEAQALRVLIVEDEFFISLDTKALVEALGHAVAGIAVSADQAIALAERERPDVVLMDIRLNGMRDGIEAAREIGARLGIRSIFVTANSDPGTRSRAQAVQPLGFLEKPLTQQRLAFALGKVVEDD
jgi:two-component system, response regulator PdtaR